MSRRPDPPGETNYNAESQHAAEFDINVDVTRVLEHRNQIKEEYLASDDQSAAVSIGDDDDEEDDDDNVNTNDVADDDDTIDQEGQHNDGDDVDMTDEFVPDCTQANKLSFYQICRRLEILYNRRKSKGAVKRPVKELISCLLPDTIYRFINGTSFFPLLRLILPDLDTSRPHTGMKERAIAVAWADALGFTKQSRPYQKLLHFNDPGVAGPAAGDLSMAVFETMKDRYPETGSNVTIGQINDLLDELVAIKNPFKTTHDWRSSSQVGGQLPPQKKKNKPVLRRKWAEKLIRIGLSPLEHKWLVRILLQKMEVGMGSKTILQNWRKHALNLYQGNNNLKAVCTLLCNPSFVRNLQAEDEERRQAHNGNYMDASVTKAVLGNTISPMLSSKTSFATAMTELTEIHHKAIKSFATDDRRRAYLPITQPCFIAEVKLDGERIVCHVNQGRVTMQTRNAVWYSDLYCPCLAPAIRKAMAKWDVNVILDGEVLSWDDGRKEHVRFGTNRAVARARKMWMEETGLLEQRDLNLHSRESDKNAMSASAEQLPKDSSIGRNCWLKYVLFDIMYVDGPSAHELLALALQCDVANTATGSIVHLSCFERKRILHSLIEPVENQVEHVPALVIRPDGTSKPAKNYFSPTSPFMVEGHLASTLDSANVAVNGDPVIPDRSTINEQQREGRSDAELSLRRTEALDRFYSDIVINQGLEGLVLKDLNSQYLIAKRSHWFKHKPDFESFSDVADIDLVVLGGFYGTGMGPAKLLYSFLLGCVDPENPETFFTFCKVSGGGASRKELEDMLRVTGYLKPEGSQEYDIGKWFKEKDHDKRKKLPEFISNRSLTVNGNSEKVGTTASTYPDLWIHPEDSVVLTVKAAEIVESRAFTAGITLRFPRIDRVRSKNSADDKSPYEAESFDALQDKYREMLGTREGSGTIAFQSGTPCRANQTERRFLTVEEAHKKTRTKASRKLTNDMVTWKMPTVDRQESSALKGLTFVVLEGNYGLDEMDAEEARQRGWWDSIKSIKTREDVMRFILTHGGSVMLTAEKSTNFVLGGSPNDPRVVKHYEGLEAAKKGSRTIRNKKGMTLDDMVQIGFVLKWTFIFFVVNKFIEAIKDQVKADGETQTIVPGGVSIQRTHSHLLKPTRHDYLRASATSGGDDDNVYGISLIEKLGMVDFKRGLAEVQRTEDRVKRMKGSAAPEILPWQQVAMFLPPEQRWVFGTPQTKFWPWKEGSAEPCDTVVVYPDLFGENFGSRVEGEDEVDRWAGVASDIGSISAALPMMRVMEAKVSAHLHKGVTHILCNLVDTVCLSFIEFDAVKFANPKTARHLRTRLLMLHPSGANHLLFISPAWVQAKYDE